METLRAKVITVGGKEYDVVKLGDWPKELAGLATIGACVVAALGPNAWRVIPESQILEVVVVRERD